MKTAAAKAKGREFQKYLARTIYESFDLSELDARSCSMGASGCDVILSQKAVDLVPLYIEAKNHKKAPGSPALDQAREGLEKTNMAAFPVAVWKPPRKPMNRAIAYLYWEDLLKLIKKVGNYE